MERSSVTLIAVAVLAVAALAALAYYRRRQKERARRVAEGVKDYLVARYGGLPNRLNINCSDDPLWPVLVDFDDAGTGPRHRLRFTCRGLQLTPVLLSEKEEER